MRARHFLPITLLAITAVGGCTTTRTPVWTYPAEANQGAAAPVATPAHAAESHAPAAMGDTLEIEAFDLGFRPASLTVPAPGRYTVELNNTGTIPHDVTFPGGEQAVANGGESATVEVDIPAERLTFICSVPGHEQGGMKGAVSVEGAAVEPAPANPDDHGGPARKPTWQPTRTLRRPFGTTPLPPCASVATSTTSTSS